jgi:hypothetical protein
MGNAPLRSAEPASDSSRSGRLSHRATYQTAEFLDDLRRLALALAPERAGALDVVEHVAGRRVVVDPSLLELLTDPGHCPRKLAGRYDADLAADRLERLVLVLDWVDRCRDRLREYGLAGAGTSPAVCEELLEHLLNVEIDPPARRLPDQVLTSFLDAWSHRWM